MGSWFKGLLPLSLPNDSTIFIHQNSPLIFLSSWKKMRKKKKQTNQNKKRKKNIEKAEKKRKVNFNSVFDLGRKVALYPFSKAQSFIVCCSFWSLKLRRLIMELNVHTYIYIYLSGNCNKRLWWWWWFFVLFFSLFWATEFQGNLGWPGPYLGGAIPVICSHGGAGFPLPGWETDLSLIKPVFD